MQFNSQLYYFTTYSEVGLYILQYGDRRTLCMCVSAEVKKFMHRQNRMRFSVLMWHNDVDGWYCHVSLRRNLCIFLQWQQKAEEDPCHFIFVSNITISWVNAICKLWEGYLRSHLKSQGIFFYSVNLFCCCTFHLSHCLVHLPLTSRFYLPNVPPPDNWQNEKHFVIPSHSPHFPYQPHLPPCRATIEKSQQNNVM